MDVRHLSILRELGDRGSVTAVAQALFITPSAVSQQLAVLQRGVPVALTQRCGRSLVLTDAGRALADAATDVATALARAEVAVDAFLGDPRGTVRVAAFSSAATAFFPALLQAGGPTVECAEHDVSQSRFPALCADHDVVLAHRLDSSPPWPTTIAVTPLLHEPLDVAVPVGHALARHTTLTAEQVVAEPWIAVHEGFPLLAPLEAIAAAAGRPLTIAHRINDLTVAAGLVTAGAGLALMPRHTAPSAPGLVLRPLDGMDLARHIDALVRPERALRSSVGTVLATLTSAAEALATSTD
ncbi:LysR family transcriptional regulator [Modestobacter muralis]|uniref:LysR family transcriptional regulator n=1 Tax=Modestobacter muralis TaxID=1608614 RepID=A0A6P0EZK8_9ACTN|nr:LysR family transcriptional regulator [Modestobacter muralis]NEK96340.1 LysR family transcriptional regulator [Modestobacter muralis]NEN53240.1 LysR family transcriptional regulator [Modestobacter muralis]